MKSKKRICILLLLVFIVNSVFPWTSEIVLAQDEETITIADKKLRGQVVTSLNLTNNSGALVEEDSTTEQLKIDFDKIKYLVMDLNNIDMDNTANRVILSTLISRSDNLESIILMENTQMCSFDFSIINNKTSVKTLVLYECGLMGVPDLTLPNLITLNLSENNFGEQGACANIDAAHFPNLNNPALDDCRISDISFLQNLGTGKLRSLRLGRNRLTDASLDTLAGMKDTSLSELTSLLLGEKVYTGTQTAIINFPNTNTFTDTKLASLPTSLQNLTLLDLSRLEITSLKNFAGLKDKGIKIDFQRNKISDFAGMEGVSDFDITHQQFDITDMFFVRGEVSEMPALLKRVADPEDVLKGNIKAAKGITVDTAAKTILVSEESQMSNAEIEITSGKLYSSKFSVKVKDKPDYTVPTDLTAMVGQTLSQVALPEGFTWKDATADVGSKGEHTFKAVYTPKNMDKYVVVDDIDIKVVVEEPHVHNWNDTEWQKDNTGHWHECVCGEKSEVQVHSYGEWIVDKEATQSEAGMRHRICDVCGYVEESTIAADAQENPDVKNPSTEQPENPSEEDTENPSEEDTKNP